MKLAAILTSHIMECIAHLPGVATQDWCDRAADAISRVWHPCGVGVMLGSLDPRGFVREVELTGAALSHVPVPSSASPVQAAPGYVRSNERAGSDGLDAVRTGFKSGDWVGWTFGPPSPELMHVASASQLGMLARRGESVVWRRWASIQPQEVLGGVVAIPGAPVGRVILIEVAWHDGPTSDSSRQAAAISAVLPMLASKVVRTFGVEPLSPSGYLTPREEMVLWHLLAGEKVPTIAKALKRSVYTVHDHVKSLHRKLNANNRGQLVARALGHLGPITPSNEPDDSLAEPTGESEGPETASIEAEPQGATKRNSRAK
jgi:DNA-binding CsgD family transcriptional regulator